jgi:hypothetical protein
MQGTVQIYSDTCATFVTPKLYEQVNDIIQKLNLAVAYMLINIQRISHMVYSS